MTDVTFSWDFVNVRQPTVIPEINGFKNVVKRFSFRYLATHVPTGTTAGIIGDIELDISDIDLGFTQFENITQTQLIDWVLMSRKESELKENAMYCLERMLNPPEVNIPFAFQ